MMRNVFGNITCPKVTFGKTSSEGQLTYDALVSHSRKAQYRNLTEEIRPGGLPVTRISLYL